MANQTVGFTIKINGVDSFDELNKAYKENLKTLKQMEKGSEEYYEQLKKVAKLKNAVSEFNRELRRQAKEFEHIENGVSAYKKLEAETRKLKNESKELAAQMLELEKAGKNNTDEYKALEKQYQETTKKAQQLDKELKEIDETVGDSFRNVGNYSSAFKDGFVSIGVDIDGFNDKLKLIAKNPLILILGALVLAVKGLSDAFKRSEKGAESFRKAGAFLQGVLSVLTNITVQLFDWIVKVFESNQERVGKFGSIIEKQVLNRIYGLVDGIMGLGKVIKAVFQRDFDAAKKALNETGEAFKNVVTADENLEGVKGKVEELTKEVVKQGMAYSNLEKAKIQAAKTNRALTKQLEDLTTQEELYNQAAGDSSLSLKEQQEAAENARKALEERAKVQIQLAQNNLSLIRQEIGLRKAQGEDISSLLDSEVGAFSELKAAQREYTLAVKNNATERRLINRDAVERTLDFLIDGVDNQKSINERLLNDEKLTFEQRAKILKDTKDEFDNSFKEQIKTIENFAGIQINSNDLINESNAKVLDEKVRALGVDDVIAGRLLEIIRDRKTGLQDLNEAETGLNEKRIDDLLKTAEIESKIANQVNEIKFEKGLISQEEFNKLSLESDLMRLETELKNAELNANEKIKLENDIELKRLEIRKAAIETDLSDIDRKYELEAMKADKAYLNAQLSEKEHEDKLREIEDAANSEKLEYLQNTGDENLEFVQELADREVEIAKAKNEKILQDERESQQKKLNMASEINGRLQTITNSLFAAQLAAAEDNEEKQLEIQRKQFNVNKVFTITDIAIDTAGAIMKTLATYGTTPIGIALSALAGATGAAQAVAVASQAPPMADGGFTGRGGVMDETGERSTGIYRLHEGEYVAPRSQVESMPFLFNQLENNRRTGARLTPQNTNRNSDGKLLKAISMMQSNIKVVADSEEIVRLGTTKQQLKKSKNL